MSSYVCVSGCGAYETALINDKTQKHTEPPDTCTKYVRQSRISDHFRAQRQRSHSRSRYLPIILYTYIYVYIWQLYGVAIYLLAARRRGRRYIGAK